MNLFDTQNWGYLLRDISQVEMQCFIMKVTGRSGESIQGALLQKANESLEKAKQFFARHQLGDCLEDVCSQNINIKDL
jgi:hypothetical protein